MTDTTDTTLVAQVLAASDRQAFGELVRRHQGPVRAVLQRLCRERALADDLAQDTFLTAWDRLHTWNGTGTLRAWLMRIAYNTFLQHVRRGKREQEVHEAVPGSRAERWSGASGVDGASAAGETGAELDRLLAVLDDQQRAVMLLSYAHGMSHSEISAVTGLPPGTVKSSIHRAKARIRKAFSLPEAHYGS